MDGKNVFDLSGKVAIVTGSTKGIGRAMVEGLALAGAAVVVSSRKQDLCDQVAKEVETATGADVLVSRATPEHPRAKTSSYVFEHILVAEELLGRYLEPGESVHHRNGIRD